MQEKVVTFINLVVKRPFLMIALCLFMAIGLGTGGQKLVFDNDYRVFFTPDNPQMAAFDELENVYTKVDNVLFVIKPKTGNIFQKDVIQLTQDLTADSWKLPFSQRVDSVTNFQHTYAQQDDLIVIDLVEGDVSDVSERALKIREQIALAEPTLAGKLINSAGTTTGVNVTINLPGKVMTEVPEIAIAARELVTKYRAQYPNIEIRPSGFAFMNNAFMETSMMDMMTLMPLMFGALLLIMGLLVRSIFATFATLLVIMFATMSAMGFGGWMGFVLTPPSAITPNIVMTLAIADSIHIIMSMMKCMHAGMPKKEAIIESIRINMQPVFLTSLTTIIGFLTLNFAESPPFWHLGNMTAMGIAAAFIFSMTMLPALLILLPVKFKAKPENYRSKMDGFAEFVVKRSRPLLVVSLLVTIGVGSMTSKIELNDQFVEYFAPSMDFRADTDFMTENLSGIYTAEYSVPARGSEQISDPEYLQNLENLTEYLRMQPGVDHVFSMSDIFKRLNKNMHNDSQDWYKTPDEQDMAAQYLLLYEFSLPYGLDLTDRVNIDKSATRITVTLTDMTTKELRAFKAQSDQWIKDNLPDFMHSEATSPGIMFSFISERNITAMVFGNLISLILISGIIMFALRSFKIGAVSLVPNLLPLAVGFGMWGLLIGTINMAASFAFAACIGIIVDDTVHFLSKYVRARREKGYDAREAVRYAFNTVGTALLVTTVILVGGFGVLTMSTFQMNSFLGLLAVFVIGSALILDFILLPSLLILLDDVINKFKKEGTPTMKSQTTTLLFVVILSFSLSDQAIAKQTKDQLLKAGDVEQIGEAIAIEFDERDLGFESQISIIEMTLKDAHGGENSREMESRILERPERTIGDKSLLIFYTPRDLNGTAFLSFAEILKQDDQWLYLPSIKRVKRISSKNKSGPFVGSEFAYEDITGNEIGKYSWRYDGLESCPVIQSECFKLTTIPKYEHSGYTKRIAWIDTQEFRTYKLDFYDRKGALAKTQTFEDYRQHLGKYWRADTWTMTNHLTGKSTILHFKDYKFKTGLNDDDFSKGSLQRVR
jgi:predicted RND superfamily exporter protein/outer membrane lipoprotein-sorting protein